MKKIVSSVVVIAVATACASASASIVTFEGFVPGIYTNGDVLTDGTSQITVRGQNGIDGAILDGTDPNRCDIAVCPAGSIYYAAFNDGAVSLGFGGNTFLLKGVDFGFILPVNAIVGSSVGQLIIRANDGSSVSQDFAPQDAKTGLYGFTHWDVDALFGRSRFTEVTFSACLYDGNGACVNPSANQAQFALDNIVAVVPEPGSLPLVALSLAGMLVVCRRQCAGLTAL